MRVIVLPSGTDHEHAGVPGETVTTMMVKGLIERDGAGVLTLLLSQQPP